MYEKQFESLYAVMEETLEEVRAMRVALEKLAKVLQPPKQTRKPQRKKTK